MSYRPVQQLERVGDEYAAVAVATAYMERIWHPLSGLPEVRLVRFSHIQTAVDNLEFTYTVRLLSEFEALLREHVRRSHPGIRIPQTAEALVNRVALRERIPDPIRTAVQRVREYRNLVAHRTDAAMPVLDLRAVLAALNRFLAQLPDYP